MTRTYLAAEALLALAVLVAVLVFATSGAHHSAGGPTLNATSFETRYERGWWLATTVLPRGDYRYELSSTRARLTESGVPPAGTIVIAIHEAPVSFLPPSAVARAAHSAKQATPSPVALLPFLAGVPPDARLLAAARPRPASLSGAEAGEASYAYAYGKRQNVQQDLLAEHGGHVVLMELDSEAARAAQARAALETVTRAWSWR